MYFRLFIKRTLSLVGLFLFFSFLLVHSSPVFAAVIINEVLPRTDDPSTEFIELYNNGADSVSLDRWTLQNTNGTTKSFMFNASSIIQSKTFLTVYQSQSGISLNSGGDTVRLSNDKNNPVDSQSYIGTLGFNTPMGRSIDGAGVWTVCTTPATPNQPNDCPAPTPAPTALPTQIPAATPTLEPSPTELPTPIPTDIPPVVIPTVPITPAVLGAIATSPSAPTTPVDNSKFIGIAMILVSGVWVGLIGLYVVTHRKK